MSPILPQTKVPLPDQSATSNWRNKMSMSPPLIKEDQPILLTSHRQTSHNNKWHSNSHSSSHSSSHSNSHSSYHSSSPSSYHHSLKCWVMGRPQKSWTRCSRTRQCSTCTTTVSPLSCFQGNQTGCQIREIIQIRVDFSYRTWTAVSSTWKKHWNCPRRQPWNCIRTLRGRSARGSWRVSCHQGTSCQSNRGSTSQV